MKNYPRELVLQGNIKTVCELGVLSTLHFFNGVPEGFTVCVLPGNMVRQKNFRADHAALVGVVGDFSIVFAAEFFSGSVGSRSDSGLPLAALNLFYIQME